MSTFLNDGNTEMGTGGAAPAKDRKEAVKTWYDSIFSGCGGETLPVKDGSGTERKKERREYTGRVSADSVRSFCRNGGMSEEAFFITAFGMALQAYTASEQAVFSVICHDRSAADIDGIGSVPDRDRSMDMKVLPVRFEEEPQKFVIDTIRDVQNYMGSAIEDRYYDDAGLRGSYGIEGEVLFSYLGETAGQEAGGRKETEREDLFRTRASFEVDICFRDDKTIYISQQEPSRYSSYTMEGFVSLLDHIVTGLIEQETVGEISLISEEDRNAILTLHDTAYPVEERPAYRLLQDSAERYPDRTALIAIDRRLTYAELNAEANVVGHVLREKGAGPETIVAVLADRDSYAYVMREGVLRSGGAFMPVDPEYPEERIRFILEDSGSKLLISTRGVIGRRKEFFEALKREGITVIDVMCAVGAETEAAPAGSRKEDRNNLNVDVPSDALAYVIYTSGSTGRPKGVMLTNRNLVNYAAENGKNRETLAYTEKAGVNVAIAAFTFDVSITEQFVPFTHGMTNVLATREQMMDAAKMCELMVQNHVDVINCTPSYIMNMIEIPAFVPAVRGLRSIDVGAEAFPPVLFDRLRAINPELYIVNTYGPTECTVSCTLKEVTSSDDVTIGEPLANVTMATMDRNGRVQPLGAMGELVIMGDGVGRGYIGREDLNERNFIRVFGLPAYRSGDLVRIREDGEIEFHGRMDDQVKLRGLRVELGEVESVIGTYPSVRSSVVIVAHGETDYLAAYFTADEKVEIASLKEHIGQVLTAYMVPQAFLQLDVMPMTANGKVDRKALPVIEINEEEILPAETKMQEKILEIVKEVIGTDRIGITTDLFASGLSSIGCIRLCSLLSDAFSVNVKVAEIFECRTGKSIEALIGAKSGEETVSYLLRESYPLTETQMGIYIDSERYAGSTVYNIPYLYKLDDRVDMERLRSALQTTLLAHPYLFMTMRNEAGEIRAVRNHTESVDIRIYDALPDPVSGENSGNWHDAVSGENIGYRQDAISGEEPGSTSPSAPGGEFARLVNDRQAEALVRPFDLTSGERLFRVELYDTEEGKYLFIDTHHIVSDGESLNIFFRDLDAAYRGETVPVEAYTGYEAALDEAYLRTTDRPASAKAWYDSIFLGCGGTTLPVSDGTPTERRIERTEWVGGCSADEIRSYCEEKGLTRNAFFTTAFGLALQTYTASEQAVFSTIYNGRSDSRTARSISMFVKTLPVRFEADHKKTVRDTILDCQKYLLSAMANDIYSFVEISKAYGIGADILFAYQGEKYEVEEEELCGYPVTADDLSSSQARALIDLDVVLNGDEVEYISKYAPSTYSEHTVKGLARLTDRIVGEFLRKETLSEVVFVSEEEEKAILGLHDTDHPVPERPAYRLLQDSAEKYPDRTALFAVDRALTYSELNREANAVGHVLREKGAGPETIVAVLADRDSYAYVMRQGVLKSGGAFLPIDPEYPEERIRFILEDSGAKLLITTGCVIDRRKELFDALRNEGITVIDAMCAVGAETEAAPTEYKKKEEQSTAGDPLEEDRTQSPNVFPGRRDDLNEDVPYDALAYVIYTSGSTGRPKGVMLTNRNLVNFVDANEKNREILGYTERGSVSLAIAALTFDFAIMEEFVPIANGMTVVLATQEQILNPDLLAELMMEHKVDVMSCTPGYLSNLLSFDSFLPAIRGLRSVDLGAEAFPPSLYGKLTAVNPGIYIMNGYGPTEATISCTMEVIHGEEDITIGIPNANVHVATVDREGHLQPPGAMGELVILGEGVGRGYIGREDLNAKNFIRLLGMPAYRSGDLVRIRKDGKIEFHGRIDDQVKLRGLRIELGEVESVIGSYPSVRSAVAIVIHGETDYLAAYFTADETVDLSLLREHAAHYLTSYMIPQAFLQLDVMPMTANGKVDRKALPVIGIREERLIPAENEVQEKILGLAKEVTGNESMGITTDLFMAGLSSMGCIRLCSLLADSFAVTIRFAELFNCRTVKGIEALIGSKEDAVTYELQDSYPLTATQTGIYIDSELYADTTVYNIPYLYKLDNRVDPERLRKALQTTLLAHPYLFMNLREEEGELRAVRHRPECVEIRISKAMPDPAELVRPFDLTSGERLFRIELFDTGQGLYLFFDVHHIVMDGESLRIFFEDLNAAYRGENVPTEVYTGYEAALDEAAERKTDRAKTAKAWYDSVFLGCGGETLPERDGKPTESRIETIEWSGRRGDGIRSYCKEHGLSLNAFFTAAFGMALQICTSSDHAVFSTVYNGRTDSRMNRSISMYVKTLPVYVKADPAGTVRDLILTCRDHLQSAMANDIYSFAEISKAYGIGADILFAYQGEDTEEEISELCGYPVSVKDLALSQAKALIDLDISLHHDSVIYHTEYQPSAYTEDTVRELMQLTDHIAGEFLTRTELARIPSVSGEEGSALRYLQDRETVADMEDRVLRDPEDRETVADREGQVLRDPGDRKGSAVTAAGSGQQPYSAVEGSMTPGEDRAYPENDIQKQLQQIVREVIGIDRVGMDTDLFTVGLSSLSCIRMIGILKKTFHANISFAELFNNRTLRRIEHLIVGPAEEKEYELRSEYPLSMTQMGIYVESIRYAGTTVYNIPFLYRLDPEVDLERLKRALDQAIGVHAYIHMRLRFDEDGNVIAVRNRSFTDSIPISGSMPEPEALVQPFDLMAEDPLYRIRLFDTGEGKYLFLDFHHIIMDGESYEIFLSDVNRAYLGENPEPEAYSGFEYALDEEEKRSGKAYEEAQDFYDSVFRGCEPGTLPVKESKTEGGHIAGGEKFGEAGGDRIRRFCLEHHISENAFFTTVFGLALASYTASEEAVFTTIYNGRNDPRLTNSVGMYVKTLPVLIPGKAEASVLDVLDRCHEYLIGAMSHDIFSFTEISNRYGIPSDVIFEYQGDADRDPGTFIGGYPAQEMEGPELSQAKASIDMNVSMVGDRIRYEYEYDPALYTGYTLDGLVEMMDRIASELLNREKLSEITLFDEAEEEKLLSLHDTDHPVSERPAYRLLQDSAEKYPDRTALFAVDRSLTYSELNREANAVGHVLREKGAGPETIVAVLADRDSYAYVMRQGVLKSGGAFLPIDPEYPEERIRFILEDSGAKLLITTGCVIGRRKELFEALRNEGITVVDVGLAVGAETEAAPAEYKKKEEQSTAGDPVEEDRTQSPEDLPGGRDDLNVDVPYDALAYVIYTSGSTGRPKGVMLTNRNLVNFVDANEKNREILGYTERGSVSLAIAALTFDFAIMEEFVPIANGMTVVLATQEQILNPDLLAELMMEHKVDVMSCTPGYLSNLLSFDSFLPAIRGLRSVDLGAEAFPPSLYGNLTAVNPGIYIMNGYGPTEATISCTMEVIHGEEDITIGIPNANVHVATMDREGRLQPPGAMGELVILGDGVGSGYIGREDLNEKNFIRLLGMPAYRSGDLVRIRKDGKIEFHGRIDDQVKLRGLRVELGEVESVIGSYPSVRSAVAIVIHGETDYLAAYFTAEEEVDIPSLKEHIGKYLTAYMVPQAYMQLESMPMTANGKIDKRALPDMAKKEGTGTTRKPENELQKTLCDLYIRALQTEVGIDDDFFAMGGTSLTAAKVLMGAKAEGLPIEYQDIFDAKTVEALEQLLLRRMNAKPVERSAKSVPGSDEDLKIEEVLRHNTREHVAEIKGNDIGDVLLMGATGFLGIHILKELIETTSCRILCLLKGKTNKRGTISPESRLRMQLYYYFDQSYEDLFGDRIVVIEGDITDEARVASLEEETFDTVINCAAVVKHFADFHQLKQVNTDGVEHLIELCLRKKARLIQISTTSISGEVLDESMAGTVLTESCLFVGQDITSNAYVHTKYLAEEKVLRAVAEQGLDAKIMRVGNLMSRQEDGEFQINFSTNNFMNSLRAYACLGCFPYAELDDQVDFSPIDETARFILRLSGTDSRFTVFHVYNSHTVDMGNVLMAMDRCGIPVETVPDHVFTSRLNRGMADDTINTFLSPLISYDLTDDAIRRDVPCDNRFTIQALYRLGLHWSITDMDYLEQMIRRLQTLGFFDN